MKNKKNLTIRARKLIIVTICILLLIVFTPRVKTVWEFSERISDLEEQKNILLQEKEVLLLENEMLNDPLALEKIAREELRMVKNGETLLIQVINDE